MLLVKNARHLDAPVDLLVNDGKIVTMTPAGHCEYGDADIIDANGLVLMPSLADCHVHFREPGFEYKEDIDSGLETAARGGFGQVMCMANTKPVNDSASVTSFMLQQAAKSHPHGPELYPIAAATVDLAGREMAPLEELKKAGCIAVSNDGRPMENMELLRRVMEYAGDLGMVYIDHCEDPYLSRGWQMHEGEVSGRLGLKGQPGCGEAIQASRDIMLAEYLDLPVHIAHVSSKLTVDVIAWGKGRGVKVTAETCPHYLVLDDTIMEGYNSMAKVSPPIRETEDRDALRQALKDGIIDILVTDHAPHAMHEKKDVLDHAPCGISGLDTALSLTYDLARQGILPEDLLHRLWAYNPANIFGLKKNEFMPGDPASFILFDPSIEWTVNRENMFSKSCNTPFLNKKMRGRVAHHWIDGFMLF